MIAENASDSWTKKRLIMCAGPGGVGKTTCSASIALALAAQGRRVIAVTIDPSKRLAQSLGLSNQAFEGEIETVRHDDFQLDALVLNPKWVFKRIVRACFSDEARVQSVLQHPIYQAASQQLAGALEFAAMARVQMLLDTGDYDTIILDTPPTANAIDFLSAPKRLQTLIKNPATQLFMKTSKLGGAILGVGQATIYKVLEKVGGADVLKQLEYFFRDFSEILQAFYVHAQAFEKTLHDPRCGVVLITSATTFSIREACAFLQTLEQQNICRDAVILNQVDPPFNASADVDDPALRDILLQAKARGEIGSLQEKLHRAAPDAMHVTIMRRAKAPESLAELQALGTPLVSA